MKDLVGWLHPFLQAENLTFYGRTLGFSTRVGIGTSRNLVHDDFPDPSRAHQLDYPKNERLYWGLSEKQNELLGIKLINLVICVESFKIYIPGTLSWGPLF